MTDYTSTDLEIQEERLAERREHLRQLARLAAQQVTMPEGKMVGRFFVPPHWSDQLTAALTPAVYGAVHGYKQGQYNKDLAEYKRQDEEARKAWLASEPQVSTQNFPGPTEDGSPLTGSVPSTHEQRLDWLNQGKAIPSLRSTITKAFEDELIKQPERDEMREWRSQEFQLLRESKQAAAEAAREARAHEAQLARDARAYENFQNRAARHDEAEANRSLRKTIADAVDKTEKGDKPPKTTESERSSAGYLTRMQAAESLMQAIGDEGNIDWRSHAAGMVPYIGDDLQNLALSPKQQQMLQAQRDWVRAKLRKESGASIGDAEMANEIRTYFPMPGDGPEVVAQKAQARKEAEKQVRISGGAAVSPRERTYNPQTGRLE